MRGVAYDGYWRCILLLMIPMKFYTTKKLTVSEIDSFMVIRAGDGDESRYDGVLATPQNKKLTPSEL